MSPSSPQPEPPAALPALVTPFDGAGHLAVEAHEHNITVLTERGVTGFLIAGSTGEGPYLLPGERASLLAGARRRAPEAFLLCGISAQSVAQALHQLGELNEADAALVVTPNTYAPNGERQVVFYRAVADAAAKPVWLYTVPAVTGYNLPVEAIVALAGHPNIVGIKDSSGMPERIDEIRQKCPEDFLIFAGASRALAASRRRGADGAITASANYAFHLVDDIVDRSPGNDGVAGLQSELTELARVVEAHGIPGTKTVATLVGLMAGVPRSPLLPLDRDTAAMLRAAVGSFLDLPAI